MTGLFLRRIMSTSAIAATLVMPAAAFAQAAPAVADPAAPAAAEAAPAASGEFLGEIVVTASAIGRSKMQSSVSSTDVQPLAIANLAPRSEAEVFKLIPGIRAESTAGPGGNSNITVRGLPLASGGSKYVQLQEDGLPIVEFGDIAFGNNDYWTRYDFTVDRIQAIRGGSASTFASQAPGAIINYISKTGEQAGGRAALTSGLGYNDKRADFDYGAPINETLRANIGGFYHTGEGPRDQPYHALEGYQVKANVTKTFDEDKGYIRLLAKRLDDRAPTYTSAPFAVKLDGNKIVGYDPLPGYDARKDLSASSLNRFYPTVTADGTVKTGDNREGIHTKSTSIGAQLHYEIGDHFMIDDRGAYVWNKGTFASPFFGSLTNVAALTSGATAYRTTVGGTTYVAARALYANGPYAGQAVSGGTVVNQNPNLYTDMTNMNHWANDLGLTGKYNLLAGTVTGRLGFYHSRQNIGMDWHWNNSFNDASANNPARIDLYTAAGVKLTDNGLSGYNNQWGGNNRRYDLNYTTDAPYLSLNYDGDALDIDGSVRYDSLKGGGIFYPTGGIVSKDVNGDGALSIAERQVYATNFTTPQPIDYRVHYTSWSVGANYRFSSGTAVFGRVSQGYRANADRVVSDFAGAFTSTGQLTTIGKAVAVNPVTQQEIGIKQRGRVMGGSYGLFLTGFRSQATEYNYDLTSLRQTFQRYKTYGLELESQYSLGKFSMTANLVYTHSRIAQDLISNNTGNTPRATPTLQYTIAPTYDFGIAAVGLTLIGQTSSYPQDDNILKQDGSNIVSTFVRVSPYKSLDVTLNVNNVFNGWDQSGRLDQGTVGDLSATGALYGVPYAATNRVGLGRTFSATLGYRF